MVGVSQEDVGVVDESPDHDPVSQDDETQNGAQGQNRERSVRREEAALAQWGFGISLAYLVGVLAFSRMELGRRA